MFVATAGEPGQMSDVARLIEDAYRNVHVMSNPAEIDMAANEIAKVAAERHVNCIVAASSAAQPLVASTTERSNPLGCLGGKVLLVDINFASGTSFSRAASVVRSNGATAIYGVTVYRLGEQGPTAAECGLDELVVLRSSPTSGESETVKDLTRSGLLI